jgi:hypothetical protein
MHELKRKNAEKDQQWKRPPLEDFDESRDVLTFQQIEAEEGVLNGGKTTIKLFGVTEVGAPPSLPAPKLIMIDIDWPFCHVTRH